MQQIDEQKFVLKTFQLRAARAVTNIELKAIGKCLNLTAAAISLWEHKDNFIQLTTPNENILTLEKVFARYNIFFPDRNSIALNEITQERRPKELTRFQLKAARTILNVSQEKLADSLNVSRYVILRAELLNNCEYIRPFDKNLPTMLRNWFENRGIIFRDDSIVSFFEKEMS